MPQRISGLLVCGLLLLVLAACGGGGSDADGIADADRGDGAEQPEGARSDADDQEAGFGGGTLTFDGETFELERVACGRGDGQIGITATVGDVTLAAQGGEDDPSVVVILDTVQYDSHPEQGDGDFAFDGSRATGDLEFESAADASTATGTFELTCG